MGSRRKEKKNEPASQLELTAFRQVAENKGLALDQLSAALAGMLDTGDDPYAAPRTVGTEGSAETDTAAVPTDEAPADSDAACEITPRSILEAILFVGSADNAPITSQQVAGLMRGVRAAEIDDLVRELNDSYAARNCPYAITAEGPGYRLTLRDEYTAVRDHFYGRARQARLSRAAIEVLAAVAYRPGIGADEIARLRGVPSGPLLLQLVRRQLIRLERSGGKPRTVCYYPTDRFLELFGLSSLEELPRGQSLEES